MQNVFSLLYNDHPLYKKCLNLRHYDENINFELITNRALSKGGRIFTEDTDIDRIWHLQQKPNAWYLDCDLVVDKWPDFEMEKGCIYVGATGGHIDTWAILGNGCSEIFDYLMAYYEDNEGKVEPLWSHRILRTELKDRVCLIPKGYFRHFGFANSSQTAERTGKVVGGCGYSIQLVNNEWELNIASKSGS